MIRIPMADDIPKRSHTKRVYQSSKDVVVETPPKKKLKITRTNHAIDGTLGIAKKEWDDTSKDKRSSIAKHAHQHGLKSSTLEKYLRGERTLGKSSGRPSKVKDEIADVLVRCAIENANKEDLTNMLIEKLQIMTGVSRREARDYVRRTLKKRIAAHPESLNQYGSGSHLLAKRSNTKSIAAVSTISKQKVTQEQKRTSYFERTKNRFKLIPLPPGTSGNLNDSVDKYVEEEKQDVFCCESKDDYSSLSEYRHGQFEQLKGTDSSAYTDKNRKLQNMRQGFIGKDVIAIEDMLQTTLCVSGYRIMEPVLLTTKKEKKSYTIYRQKLHMDFKEGDDSMFVIIALSDNQNLYYEFNGAISSIELPKDHAFVGHASLVHAGSEQEGKRLHFKLVSEDYVEDTKTYFVKDSLFPGIKGVLDE